MANNVLTDLSADLYEALDRVSQELVGFIPSVSMENTVARAAVGDTVRSTVSTATAAVDVTPTMAVSEPAAKTVNNVIITISKSRATEFGFIGEEQRKLDNGAGYSTVQVDEIAQAMRTLVNEIETDLGAEFVRMSRAVGIAGTTPFGSDFKVLMQAAKIIKDNGGWVGGQMSAVMNTTAGVNLNSLTSLTNVNEAGTDDLLRQGVLTRLSGYDIRESQSDNDHTKGTGTAYIADGGSAIGDTSIPIDTGSGTVVVGDVVTFAGDTNKYLVTTGVAAPGTIVIAAPGLRQTLADSGAMTIGDGYNAAVATFRKGAFHLATRAPALPKEGDLAIDRMTVTDARSGLSFEISVYPGHRKVKYEVAIAWGYKIIKVEDTALILG